ncbi:MAG: phage major capsid protein [bacterium]
MKINELKQERSSKIEEMNNLLNEVQEAKRDLNEDETQKWENLRKEVETIDSKIEKLEKQEELNRSIVENNTELNENERNTEMKETKKRTLQDVISERMSNNRIEDFRITTRDMTTDNASGAIAVDVQGLSVIGKQTMKEKLQSLGFKYMSNLNNDVKLPYMSPIVAGNQSSGYTNSESLGSVTLSADVFSVTETFDKKLLASGNEAVINEIIEEMIKGTERKMESKLYDVAISEATEVSEATEINLDNMQTLESQLDADGVYLMPRSLFFTAKNVKLDDGSGKFLFSKVSNEQGESFEGTPALYSNLFDGSQIVYTAPESIVVGDWSEYEVTFDTFSRAQQNEVKVTVSKIANVVSRNPAGAVKTALA